MPGESERIGELLIAEGIITQEELAKAIQDGGLRGSALGSVLESTPHVKRADLAAFLAGDFRIPALDDLRKIPLSEQAAKLVPEELARKHELVPLCRMGDILCIAKANYFNRAALNDLKGLVPGKIKVLQADEAQVRAAFERIYRGKKGDLPAPSMVKKETAKVAAVTLPSALEEIASFEAIPLISPGSEEHAVPAAARRDTSSVPQAAATAVAAPPRGYDEVIEIMDAIRMAPQDFAAALRDPFARLVCEFDDMHQLGRAVPPARVS
ncbi:MAG TPA: hypothetical protein VEN81_05275 [Planctomycetota bacterium]|nr:hypothetical protein [Planctomycetota bacterium]